MELIIKTYGKFLLEGIAVILVFGLLFVQVEDADGNRGILHIIGAHLQMEQTGAEYTDFITYQSEGKKNAPVISFTASNVLYTGTYSVTDCITAVGDNGVSLPVTLLGVWDPFGVEQDAAAWAERGQLVFEDSGIYTVKVAAVDTANRKTVCLIPIPVNRRKNV